MGIIIGYLIRLLTFPGVILNTYILKLTCHFLEIKIEHLNYFSFDFEVKNAPVIFETPTNYIKSFGLAILPFLAMSSIASIFFYICIYSIPSIHILFFWLGISIAAHSFPDTIIGKTLWTNSILEIKEGNFIALLGIPLVVIIYIAQFLHILWLDIIYGFILYMLIKGDTPIPF